MNGQKRLNKLERVILSLQDFYTLLGILFFAGYIAILERFGVGVTWLNFCLFIVTLVFAMIFLIKIVSFNRYTQSRESSQKMKIIYRLVKYLLKILMLLVIVVGLVSIIHARKGSLVVIISTIFTNLLFFYFLYRDTRWLLRARAKRKASRISWKTKTKGVPAAPPVTQTDEA